MKIHIKRLDCTDEGVFGHLITDNGFECVTLERHDIDIPTGTYPVTMYNSPHFGYIVLLLHNVPGREAIEIHCGNREGDSKGCILVGTVRDHSTVLESRKALSGLLAAIGKADDITVEVS